MRVPPPATRKELYAWPICALAEGHVRVTGGNAATVVTMLHSWAEFAGTLSTTPTPKKLVPAVLGIPVMAPVEGFRTKPAGSDPVMENVYGGVPPEAADKELYATPT